MSEPRHSAGALRAMIRGRRTQAAELRQRALSAAPLVAQQLGEQAAGLEAEATALAVRLARQSTGV